MSDLFVLSDVDSEIKSKMEVVTIMGKTCAKFSKGDIETRQKVAARKRKLHISNNEYFKRLGFEGGYTDGRKLDDNAIRKIIEGNEDPLRPGWVSTNGDWPAFYARAHSEHMKFRDFINFFGYSVEEGDIKGCIDYYAYSNHSAMQFVSVNKSGEYVIKDTGLKNKFASYARTKDMSYSTFLNFLIAEWKNHWNFVEPIPDDSERFICTNQRLSEKSDKQISDLSEEEIEHILSLEDNDAGYIYTNSFQKIRKYNLNIISTLKAHYKGICQLCGHNPCSNLKLDITEAHHIEYFSRSFNNNASNIIIVCPNHHRILHRLNATYDRGNNEFVLSSGQIIKVSYDLHLGYDKQHR